MRILKEIWQWISGYFTVVQIISTFGGSAIMSGFITGFAKFLSSLGIVEKVFIWIGITLLLTALTMWIWSRIKKGDKEKRRRRKEWIAQNRPDLAELPITLARLNEIVKAKAIALSKKRISYSTLKKCDITYAQMVRDGLIKKPFDYKDIVEIKTARKILKKTIRKVGHNVKKLIDGMQGLSEVLEKKKLGLYPILEEDKEYHELHSKLVGQKAIANPKVAAAIHIYTDASYSVWSSYMVYAYSQAVITKRMRDSRADVPSELSRPLQTIRNEIDNFLDKLLANVEEVIEDSVVDYEKENHN